MHTITNESLILNSQQKKAAEYGSIGRMDNQANNGGVFTNDPLLIIAGAGTGKTNTLAHRTAHLILQGIQPERILLMTFSRRAARELAERAKRIVCQQLQQQGKNDQGINLSWIGTFHSIGNRLLRTHAKSIGLEPGFSIVDRSDAADMLDIHRHKLGFTALDKRFPKKSTCINIYSRCVNAQAPLSDILEHHFPWCADWHDELKKLFKAYTEAKIDQASLDYDDLLLYWFHMAGEEQIASIIRSKFDHVLVDEYQDTNILQSGILMRLFPTGRGLTVVGDDAQSIYSFRSAEVENILNFPSLFSPPAKVIPLNKNYRSSQPILDLANALLKDSARGYKNALYSDKSDPQKPWLVSVEDEENQSRYIVEKVLEAREEGVALKKQAVLFRSSHHSDHLEVELRRHDIPYVKYGGLKFLDTAHVKDAISVLRWADNPKHRMSGFRVLKLIPGIGPKSAEKILDYLELHNFSLSCLASFQFRLAKSEDWIQLTGLLVDIHHEKTTWTDQMSEVAKWYKNQLEENYDNPFVRAGDIDQLAMISQQFPSRERFLSELTLDPPSSTGDLSNGAHKDDDFLVLSTVHSAKGQEWRNVHILNVADGNFPNEYAAESAEDLEEERRLFNVAITRAQRQLHLIQPLKYWIPEQQRFGGKHVYGAKSRFLTDTVVRNLEAIPYPDTRLTEADRVVGEETLADIKSRVIGMWND